ncbi:unnamed protein product [Protopolystoma xenopodis]|uniref:Uncharacterized protein n=1 Tax=Protopolystoma xenopodis TaxID=117903 RepID=A0A3S5AD17_9PLAT|nr:unnamed protein product [Protopolystoma xenopodis]
MRMPIRKTGSESRSQIGLVWGEKFGQSRYKRQLSNRVYSLSIVFPDVEPRLRWQTRVAGEPKDEFPLSRHDGAR